MAFSRSPHKAERVRITLVPTSDERSFSNIPSTFSPSSRTYGWRRLHQMEYLIVPMKISCDQIVVEMFIEAKKGKPKASEIQRVVQDFVKTKIHSEWQGLRLAGISKPTSATPPERRFVRGTIEEILGAKLERH